VLSYKSVSGVVVSSWIELLVRVALYCANRFKSKVVVDLTCFRNSGLSLFAWDAAAAGDIVVGILIGEDAKSGGK
jgi:hypothetical protein